MTVAKSLPHLWQKVRKLLIPKLFLSYSCILRKKPTELRVCCTKLHDIENQADDVYELFVKKLFEEEKDCIELIKIKEIMHELEKTTDAAERVGKILRNLIVKYA